MRVLFKTFFQGHLVSDREYDRLKKGLAKVGVSLFRTEQECNNEYDILMVKGFSHRYEELDHSKPLVYYSIGTEWKVGEKKYVDELNDPIKNLYLNADAVVHISNYCRESHRAIFAIFGLRPKEYVIIPACETNLSSSIRATKSPLKLAITCIPRPVKRIDQTEELCKKYGIELVPAYGNVSDFSYYHDCDGGICLSRKEGMPNNVLEMLSYGLPCIVTNYGGAKEAIGEAGVVIKNDPEDVAWDPSNIESIDEVLFAAAVNDFIANHSKYQYLARERVRTVLNDYVSSCQLKEVFGRVLAEYNR